MLKDQTNALLIACQLGHTAIVRELLTCYKRRTNVDDTKAKRKTSNHADIIRRCLKKAKSKGFADVSFEFVIINLQYFRLLNYLWNMTNCQNLRRRPPVSKLTPLPTYRRINTADVNPL